MSTAPRQLGKYELLERLGHGGIAEVWKALDPQLQRSVAIKLLHPNLRDDPSFTNRFEREAQLIEACRVHRRDRRWLGRQDSGEHVLTAKYREQQVGVNGERGAQVRVQVSARASRELSARTSLARLRMRDHGLLCDMRHPRGKRQLLAGDSVWDPPAVPPLIDLIERGDRAEEIPSRAPRAWLTSQPERAAYTPTVGVFAITSARSCGCRVPAQSPKRAANVSGSAGSRTLNARWNIMSSRNIAAFSGAWAVHPIARRSAA